MSILFVLVIFILSICFLKKYSNVYWCGWFIPGPPAMPLIGNIQMLMKMRSENLLETIMSYRRRFKCTFRLWLGPQLWVFLHTVAESRELLSEEGLIKPVAFQQLDVLLGRGLLISDGERWRLHRRMLTPAFRPHLFNRFLPIIEVQTAILSDKLKYLRGQTVNVDKIVFPCVLDIIIETSMGKKLGAQLDDISPYSEAFHQVTELLFKRMSNPLLAFNVVFHRTAMYRKLQSALKIIHSLTNMVIDERSAFLTGSINLNDTSRCKSLLDILLTTEIDGVALQDIRDEINTFLLAGVDTTVAAVSFIMYALAKHPLEQQKVFDECQTLDASPSLQQLNGLPCLDMFIKECLRYYTVAPITGRQTVSPLRIGDISYCKGVTVWVNLYGLAHDPDVFDEPEEFRPSRFDGTPYPGYLPFSSGPHVCIGRQFALVILKGIIYQIVHRFEIILSNPNEELVLIAEMVLKSLNGVHLQFKNREYNVH